MQMYHQIQQTMNPNFSPTCLGTAVLLQCGAKKPPKMAAACKMRRTQLLQISAGVCSFALTCAINRLLQPVLPESASSSCCCTFYSKFCAAMAEQHCSNPRHGGTASFEAQIRFTHTKQPKNDKMRESGSSQNSI